MMRDITGSAGVELAKAEEMLRTFAAAEKRVGEAAVEHYQCNLL